MPFGDDYICYKRRKASEYRIKNAVKATDKDAQYDTSAKRLLGQKSILAHILVKQLMSLRA